MIDVAIVGAGPAGLMAARVLATRGLDVTVLEEHASVGQPVHCTGILAREAFDEFELSTDTILNDLTEARFVAPDGSDFVYTNGPSEAVVVDRAAFDMRLGCAATAAGAVLQTGVRVTAITPAHDAVTIECHGRPTVRARASVLACGSKYAFHRSLGLGSPPLFLRTAQLELPATRLHEVELHFGNDVAPMGFGWAVPVLRGRRLHVRVGVMADADAPRYFQQMLARLSSRWGLDASDATAPRARILPLATIPRTYADRVVVVGDAAGLVKPTTGGGIYFALLSGALAADVLAEALGHGMLGASALAGYERRWRDRLQAELDTQLQLRMLTQRMSDHDIDQLFNLARTDGIMPIVRRAASFNRHRPLILALLRHQPARQVFYRSLVS